MSEPERKGSPWESVVHVAVVAACVGLGFLLMGNEPDSTVGWVVTVAVYIGVSAGIGIVGGYLAYKLSKR